MPRNHEQIVVLVFRLFVRLANALLPLFQDFAQEARDLEAQLVPATLHPERPSSADTPDLFSGNCLEQECQQERNDSCTLYCFNHMGNEERELRRPAYRFCAHDTCPLAPFRGGIHCIIHQLPDHPDHVRARLDEAHLSEATKLLLQRRARQDHHDRLPRRQRPYSPSP